jgi:hypothetical protein
MNVRKLSRSGSKRVENHEIVEAYYWSTITAEPLALCAGYPG